MAGVKVSEGAGFVDPQFANNRMGVRGQPFELVTYYHFMRPGNPAVQAQRLCDLVGQLRGNERFVADFEDDSNGKPAVDLKFVDAFYVELMKGVCFDRRPLIYTSGRIWEQLGNPTWDLASEIDLWAPRYGVKEPECPKPWPRWTLWQYSEEESVPGVNAPCDASVFNGDIAALRTYMHAVYPVKPAPLVA